MAAVSDVPDIDSPDVVSPEPPSVEELGVENTVCLKRSTSKFLVGLLASNFVATLFNV